LLKTIIRDRYEKSNLKYNYLNSDGPNAPYFMAS